MSYPRGWIYFSPFILCRTFLKKIVVCQIYLGRNILRIKWYWGPYPAPHSFYIWTWWIRMGFENSYHSKWFKSSYFYDGEKKFVFLLADMEKGREYIGIVWKIFENCGNFELLKVIHFYGGTTTSYCNNFLLNF